MAWFVTISVATKALPVWIWFVAGSWILMRPALTAFISRSDNNFTKVTAWCAESLFHDMQPAFEKLVTSYHSSPRLAVAGDR